MAEFLKNEAFGRFILSGFLKTRRLDPLGMMAISSTQREMPGSKKGITSSSSASCQLP